MSKASPNVSDFLRASTQNTKRAGPEGPTRVV